jgi:hypothetical protein
MLLLLLAVLLAVLLLAVLLVAMLLLLLLLLAEVAGRRLGVGPGCAEGAGVSRDPSTSASA